MLAILRPSMMMIGLWPGGLRRYHRAMARTRLKRRYGGGTGFRSNPPLMTDLAEFIGPGFAGFAVTRFVTKVATQQIAKRKPSWGRHAGAATAVGSFLAAWLLAHKSNWIEKYHTPIVVGSAIAALQSIIQLYIPMLGWMLADPTAKAVDDAGEDLGLPQMRTRALRPIQDDPNEYVYNDMFDTGRMSPPQQQAATSGQARPIPDDDLSDVMGDDDFGSLSPNLAPN